LFNWYYTGYGDAITGTIDLPGYSLLENGVMIDQTTMRPGLTHALVNDRYTITVNNATDVTYNTGFASSYVQGPVTEGETTLTNFPDDDNLISVNMHNQYVIITSLKFGTLTY
jgi:hypothetical protein